MNYLRGYLVDGSDVETQLDFRRQFGWEMFYNTLDEDEEARDVEVRRLRARTGGLGDHELVAAPKYCGNGLQRRTNGGGSIRHIRSSYAPTPA